MRPFFLLTTLLLATALAAQACGGAGGSGSAGSPTARPSPRVLAATRTPDPTPPPTATPSPTPGPPPAIDLSGSFAQQGGFLLVGLVYPPPGLTEATAQFAGGSYPMLLESDPSAGQPHWYAVIGLGTGFAPGDYPLEVTSGQTLASATASIAPGDFAQEPPFDLPPESVALLEDTAAIEEENRVLAQAYAGFTPQRLWSGAWLMPVDGPIIDPFGLQRSINGGPFVPHSGTDISATTGTPVAATAAGRVALAGPLHLRGNSVVIDHGAGVFSGYHHLDSIAVAQGQTVAAGELVGYVGATGFVSGPHLHWEAIIGGVRVDPTFWTYGPVVP